jgi:cell division cycle 20-like protein 1, cofactor of APC complex
MTGHTARVGCLAWNESTLSSGSRDRHILHRDTRAPEQHFRTLAAHRQEVCGLRWNVEENQLASGGNDNKLLIWNGADKTEPTWRFSEHTAAVKAIAWSPHQRGILASGGGTADKKIRFWNTLTGTMLSSTDTGSQVCNLMWYVALSFNQLFAAFHSRCLPRNRSKTSNEIVSTHGYSGGPVQNQVCIWKYPSMSQVAYVCPLLSASSPKAHAYARWFAQCPPRSHIPRPLPRDEPRRSDDLHRGGRRDSSVCSVIFLYLLFR